ncbi:MAG: MarR family transcriptional regulator [Alphaproteobacteria bacterium]|nr:MarR family transcriptional regulator [Alphaproteobacteria bacterium]
MTTLNIGIASYAEMKARTLAIARGKLKPAPNEPKVWFASAESFAKILSEGNRRLLALIAERSPGSLDELARASGRKKSNLSRTLNRMAACGLITLKRGPRGRLMPRVGFDRIVLRLPIAKTIRRRAA